MHPTPSTRRRVAVASPPSSVSESGLGLANRLSPTQIESNSGLASAWAASAIIFSIDVTPKKTPRCGSVNPNRVGDTVIVRPPGSLRLAVESHQIVGKDDPTD